MNFDPYAAQTAVEKLAKRHRVRLWWHTQDGPEAHVGTRQVWLDPLIDVFSYLAALHELGHIVSAESKRLGDKGHTLSCEAAAWEWAFIHVDPSLVERYDKRTRKAVRDAWATYLPDEVA